MSEDEPFLELEFQGERVRGDRSNLSLFTFIGELANHNHVFLVLEEQEDDIVATHVWHDQPAYDYLMRFIAEFNLPMHLNLNEVAECDLEAREAFIAKTLLSDLNDFLPDAWND